MFTTSVATSPIFLPERCSTPYQAVNVSREQNKLSITCPAGLGSQLSRIDKRGHVVSSKRKSSIVCSAALNAKCDATSGQTATILQKSPTITQAPVHEKSPQLDDGDSGFPPGEDGDGGGGGGGGGGNWSGGFFFFGFLAFLGFLKDKESEEEYHDR
jgi:hypothetical protein